MSERVVIVEVTIAASADEVWEALRDPDRIRRWHGWEYDGLDEEIRQIYVEGAEADEAARTIEIAGVEARFEVEPHASGAVVRVTKPAPAEDVSWDEIDEGWISFVHQLAFALQRHPGEERRTLHFSGDGSAPLTPAALGIDAGAPGESFEATTPWGERLTGSVWFRSPNQAGLAVDQLGDGLLILHARPQGGGRAILTAYGVDADGLAALERRWSAGLAGALVLDP